MTNGRGIYWGDTEEFCKSLVEPISVKIRYCDKYKISDNGQFIITDKNAISDKTIKLTVNKAIKNKVISIFKDIYNEKSDIFITKINIQNANIFVILHILPTLEGVFLLLDI